MNDDIEFHPQIKFNNGAEVGFAPINPQVDLSTPQAPSFDETVAANFRQYNLPYRLGKKLFETQYSTVGLIEREEDFHPIAEGLLEGIPREYYKNILSQKTRKDAQIVRANILQEFADYQTAVRSGLITNMVSGFGATFLDPTILIPLGQTIKYLDVTKGFVNNFGKAAIELGAFSAAQNAFLVASKETQGLSEWALDTAIDTFFAASIGGALGFYASKGISKEARGATAYFKATNIDADVNVKINTKGEFDGFELDTSKIAGVGAAEVKDIEAMMNSGRVSFRDNKLIKHVFGLGSPIVKGVTSNSEITQRITTDLWGTNFRTASGVSKAIQDPGAYDFVRSWQGLAAGLQAETRSAYLATIGVSGLAAEERASIGAIAGQYMSELEFNESVGKAYRRGYSDNPHINAVNNKRKVVFDQMWNEAKKRIPDLQDEEFTNIVNHLIRVYNKDKIAELPDQFFEAQFKYISRINQKVAAYTQNYENAATQLQQLKTQYNALLGIKSADATSKRKLLKQQIGNQRDVIKQLTRQRLDDIRSGAITRDMLESKVKVTPEEKVALDNLNKPLEKANKELKAKEKALQKATDKETKKTLKAERKKARETVKALKANLKERIINGEIADNLLYTDRFGRLHLKNPNKLPELRKVKTLEELKASALATRDTIEQLNEEQMLGAIFGQISGNTPASLKSRVNLWNDAEAEPWLINDINALTDLYLNSMAKYLYGHDVFTRYGISIEGGKESIVRALKTEYDFDRNHILKDAATPERAKALRKLDKSFDGNVDLLNKFQQAYFGSLTDTSSTPYKVSSAIRQFTSSVLLTNMPILQLTEYITPTFKHGYKEFVHDGLVGTINKMKKYNESVRARLGKDADSYLKGYYTDALVGANRLLGQSLEAKMGYAGQTYQKSWYQRFAGTTSKLTDTLSFASRIMDGQEVLEASRIESKVMRVLEKYHRGEKLLQEDIHFLDEMRIKPQDWAKRFVNQFEREVDGRQIGQMEEGGYISNYHEWDDFEASQRMRIALDRGVRAVITKPGPADVPFVFKDPIGSLLFQFLSWPFAATQNFLLPTLTEFDVQKLIGIVNIMATASLISPLRQLAKGQDVDTSFEALASSALSNSGIMGWQYDLLTRALAYLDFKLLRAGDEDTPINSALKVLLPERHTGKGLSALIGSPALGTLDMMGSVVSSILSGEYNQRDAERTIRLLAPYLYTWETQKLFKKALESTGLPETRREARDE